MRWYLVKEVQTGKMVDFISFTHIGTITLDNGRRLHLIENRHAQGISIDYQEITPEQVLLHRLVSAHQDPDMLGDVSFTPPLPLVRAPLDVGRTWRERIGHTAYVYRVEARETVSTLGRDIQDCLRVVRTRNSTLDFKTEYCPEIGIAAFELLIPKGKWLRAELRHMAPARLALHGTDSPGLSSKNSGR